MKIARGTKKPGQTKEQTRLIAQGIQKGIEQYKKQQKARLRELDKQRKSSQKRMEQDGQAVERAEIIYRQHWLPWLLLLLSWVAMVIYIFFLS